MTLVQSRLPLLNGNKSILIFLILSSFLIMSCASNKSATRVLNPVRTKPSTVSTKVDPDKVDTVSWTLLDRENYPPISNELAIEMNPLIRPIQNVSLLIPFDVSAETTLLTRSEMKFGHFYAGVLLALEKLEELDKTMAVSVFDTDRDQSKVERLLQNMDVRQSDVIVGPYETKNLKTVAIWGQQNDIPVISPWRSSSSIAENNLYYYQMRPLIEQYFEAILKDALNKHAPSNIFIINDQGKDDDTRVRAIHKMHETLNKGKITTPLSEYKIVSDSIKNSDFMMFDTLLHEHPNSALIIPNYSSRDARYVYSLIRKINAEIDDEEIEIYGMPTLVNAQRLDLEFFRSLDLNTVDFKHTDKSKEAVSKFVSNYFEKFGHLPNDDSYHGYDTMILLANSSDYAKAGGSSETSIPLPFLSMGVNFQRYHKNRMTSGGNSAQKPGDFMVNSNLKLIEYYNSRFRAITIR